MAKILELHSAKVQNTLYEVLPPKNNSYFSSWFDNSGNNNYGVLTTSVMSFNSNCGWLGSYDFSDYYNLFLGYNKSYLTVPTLNNASFPQAQGTITIISNRLVYNNANNANYFGTFGNSAIFARLIETSGGSGIYGVQCGCIGSDGLFKAIIAPSTFTTNRILLNAINIITLKYVTGNNGYFALFINGVKIGQVNITDSAFVPSSQICKFNHTSATDGHKLYYISIDNTALSDSDIIEMHNAEWKTTAYSLPILNKNYVAWGDSITWTQANGKEYPNLVHNYIKNTYGKAHYYNKGIGGLTSAELVTNLNSYNYIDGDIVTIGVGTNDCANQGISVANYTTNLGLAIDFIRSRNANAKIILCTPCGTSSETRTPYIADYRTAMEEVATAKSCYLCKFHEAVTDENIGTYSSDGIHPNVAGHVLLMAKLQPIIDEILG